MCTLTLFLDNRCQNGDGKSTAWLGTVGFAVSSQAKNPDLCAELIQSLSTDLDGQKELCGETSGKSLQIPNIMDYAQTTFKDKVNDGTIPYASNVDVIFGYIEGSDKYKGIFTETTYTYNSEWWDTFLEGMPNVLTGEVSVDDYCKQVAPKMQEALDNAIELQMQQLIIKIKTDCPCHGAVRRKRVGI